MASEAAAPPVSTGDATIEAPQKQQQQQPPAPQEPKAQQQSQKPQKEKAKKDPKLQTPAAAGEPAGEKKLSNAELKKKAKEEKAARRAQAKAGQPQPAPGAGGAAAAAAGTDAKGGKPKQQQQKQDGQPGGGAGGAQRGGAVSRVPSLTAAPKETKPSVPECFSHLSMAKQISIRHAEKDVHPAVLALGQQMGTFAVCDSISRLELTLLAFKKVINSYTTPIKSSFSRQFTSHVLNPQIVYLTACRPMCFSMGNAIRWLKLQISKLDIEASDDEAKSLLNQAIDSFIAERVTIADQVIVKTAATMIADDDVILTYAHHHLVEQALLRAKAGAKRFKVILIDDPFEQVGLAQAKRLAAAGIPVAYSSDLGALRTNLQEATQVLVAAEAMFSNGAMYARAGTCDIAAAATDFGIRVISLCETINFTERVSIDSLTYNEIDPERNSAEEFRLLFDTTRDKFISAVVTELGISSAKSVPAVIRKLEEL